MAQFELIMPKMGESVAEATIIKWVKNPGDMILADESVLEIATDKVDSEVPSPVGGKLIKLLFGENDVVQVGATIAIIDTDSENSSEVIVEQPKIELAKQDSKVQDNLVPYILAASLDTNTKIESSGKFYSPLVKNIAQSEGISIAELDSVKGTGAEGRVTKNDVISYLSSRKSGSGNKIVEQKKPVETKTENQIKVEKKETFVSTSGGDEILEMDRMRKLIADHMVMSKHTSPHVTSFVEADVTNLVRWRDKVKSSFEKREKEKITFTPIFIEAIAKAIKDFPMINVSVDGTKIIIKKNINIGMATALPSGNLIVPVIKNADQKNLIGLTKAVNDLANRARTNKLSPDEVSGGTFTMTNVGSFGNVMGTPIINQPQVAILAVGAIKKKPAVLETPDGDVIAIRHMMFCSLSYDHRVVDGSLGGSFVRRVADYLENFDVNRDF